MNNTLKKLMMALALCGAVLHVAAAQGAGARVQMGAGPAGGQAGALNILARAALLGYGPDPLAQQRGERLTARDLGRQAAGTADARGLPGHAMVSAATLQGGSSSRSPPSAAWTPS